MDALEKYVREHQAAWDRIDSVDADALWEKIQSNTPGREPEAPRVKGWQLRVGHYWWWSAAAMIVLGIGTGLWWSVQDRTEPTVAAVTDYYPHLAETEMTYRRAIAVKEAELDIDQLSRQQFVDIFTELDELERLHRQQLQELPEVFHDEDWVRTLLRYYEQKVRILERLGHEIEKDQHARERTSARSS